MADLEEILAERDACGVGVVANLKNEASHRVISESLAALGCMEHRGACSADDDSGDGAGVMTQVPWKLIQKWAREAGVDEPKSGTHGVGMVFLPKDDEARAAEYKAMLEAGVEGAGLKVVGWRQVPVDHDVVGEYAAMTEPAIEQIIVDGCGAEGDELERKLFEARKLTERAAREALKDGEDPKSFYVCTLSGRTIVYKGMLRSVVVGMYFKDLVDEDFETSFAIYHRRFSTNTVPKWPLAQPMRFLGHNGEINTVQGNLNWLTGREASLDHPLWKGREHVLSVVGDPGNSDSANLDRIAEVLVRTGRDPEEAMMICVPEAYRNHPELQEQYPDVADFYEFYSGAQEAWDGPALMVFSDGKTVGATLDRNGLRPARFWQTADDMVYIASEVGVIRQDPANTISKGRLGPGQMFSVNLETGVARQNAEIKKDVGSKAPYAEWLQSRRNYSDAAWEAEAPEDSEVLTMQTMFGYGSEDVQMVIESMAAEGKEPTFSMGDDIPLAVLSSQPHLLYDYFKQRFPQVTNPPIDPLREGLVMGLDMCLGARGNLLEPSSELCSQVHVESPVVNEAELEKIKADEKLGAVTIPIFFKNDGPGSIKKALDEICATAAAAVEDGAQLIVLSDKRAYADYSADEVNIPALLACGAVHHHLISKGQRASTSIAVETAQAFSTHHMACLVGYGASAVCPYLALSTCRSWWASSKTQSLMKRGKVPQIDMDGAQENFRKALNAGLKKILSKMGISLLSSYHGAQIFEAYGIGGDALDTGFRGSVSRIGGMSLDDIASEAATFWNRGFTDASADKYKLPNFGFMMTRPNGEYHGNNPEMSKLLHTAVRDDSATAYETYVDHLDNRPTNVLRDCLDLKSDAAPVPIDEVESVGDIMSRFCTGGMSLGAISRECHEVIAVAMNRLGGKSNSGEGGEDPMRYVPLEDASEDGKSPSFPHLNGLRNGDVATSRIKQVASGRFGVTPNFLVNADQLEIKVAQGAKPGEGGQLPGKKVSPYIAMLRRSKPGVPLISPPPHHDIYSIEDLAQLIYDLHMINKNAKVSVKLVAEAGIGTVASGVAKAGADIIQVSGHDGGTGASPVSSIKHCGGPWEMGLTETHQTLLANQLRDRVIVRADGGFKGGRDVLVAAAMGADEYGFGTIAMIATGCIMARICHTNNCPVGVASQREELRARFPGTPDDVVNFFQFVGEEVRAGLAELGMRSMDELIGRSDVLVPRKDLDLAKTSGLDVSFLTQYNDEKHSTSSERVAQPAHGLGDVMDDEILADPAVQKAIETEGEVTVVKDVCNLDRAFGGRIAGVIAKDYGDNSFAGAVNLELTGAGGQSFCAWSVDGMNVTLTGEANDYVCKGMAGGVIAIRPDPTAPFKAADASIIGNTALYGATGGHLFAAGRAGERFAVRNSLATAVVEGTGDHCLEYMTGGCVAVIGSVGRNVGAGMTGGIGYFLDEDGTFLDRVNGEIVEAQRVVTADGEAQLKGMLEQHVAKTGSVRAQELLDNWADALPKFWQLVPPSEAQTPEASLESSSASSLAPELIGAGASA